jgi:GGDEF domain-containing protein
VPANLWFDGLIAGAGLAAIGAALVFRPVLASTSGGPIAVATELAYPVGDLLLAALVMGVLALRGWRLDYTWGLLTAGFLVLALADCLYAVQVAQGVTNSSSVANIFSMLGVILLAFAAWQVEPAKPAQPVVRWSVLLLPAAFTLSALGLLVYDHFHRLNPIAFGLAIATLLAAIVRMALAFRDVRSLAEARRQASTDDLTLLPNRRMFISRTRDAIAGARIADGRSAILIFDLDNFKELNDTLGHQAGDLLLRRIGPRLKRVLRSTDMVARLSGDEFGVWSIRSRTRTPPLGSRRSCCTRSPSRSPSRD